MVSYQNVSSSIEISFRVFFFQKFIAKFLLWRLSFPYANLCTSLSVQLAKTWLTLVNKAILLKGVISTKIMIELEKYEILSFVECTKNATSLIDQEPTWILTYESIPISNCTSSRSRMAWVTIWASSRVLVVKWGVMCQWAPQNLLNDMRKNTSEKHFWPMNE